VVVHAETAQGKPATIALQVKRPITFTASDVQFQKVVGQIAETARTEDFWDSNYDLAIAIARSSQKIDGPYQDVLAWARDLGDAATFFSRLRRKGAANDDMRNFVGTFRANLTKAGYPDDEEAAWRLLRRLQILHFDFTAQGSANLALVHERVLHLLHPDEASKAVSFWSVLVQCAIELGTTGGETTKELLRADPRIEAFRLAGRSSLAAPRAALAEASAHSLQDIEYRVGSVILMRQDRVDAVRAALDQGRYVEIRGESGVGKSGLLRLFGERFGREGQVIVLSPSRIVPRGWTALRAALNCDGTARELLVDIAADGGAQLLIDGLDNFSIEEQRTAIDLVREAASIPGFTVIATARQGFAKDEPNWLPTTALNQLGRARPVIVSELSNAEVDELVGAAPQLRALLAEDHVARNVARNLYRLGRLLSQPSGVGQQLRTEVDMMDQWWRSADGQRNDGHRDRSRVLRALADRALSGEQTFDCADLSSNAVSALVRSQTLRELAPERTVFHHDVLRDWAVAELLIDHPETRTRLPLLLPAPVGLARSLELTARHAIEQGTDASGWHDLLKQVSAPGMHGSWRRAVLLALLRSESQHVLRRATDQLFADKAALLRELIRTTMAVEVQEDPEEVRQLLRQLGIAPEAIPPDHLAPSGPVWGRLIVWLLSMGESLPKAAIPDIAELTWAWCRGFLALDPLSVLLLNQVYQWLIALEGPAGARAATRALTGDLERHEVRGLESTLRTTFLIFARSVPKLAAEYLKAQVPRNGRDWILAEILKNPGTLAQAAPSELADLVERVLIRDSKSSQRRADGRDGPFGYADVNFVPASPSRGPFLSLLQASPQQGLALIRRLVDHAIAFFTKSGAPGDDVIRIEFPEGARIFCWQRSYNWSREASGPSCLTSALMALEVWAQARLDSGDSPPAVLADIVGSKENVPAAYLLICVDLVLSHWPRTRDVAVPLLASPELLCLDRHRWVHDNVEFPDVLGLRSLENEPEGPMSKEALRRRPSRRLALDVVLNNYALVGGQACQSLRDGLQAAATRLGEPVADSDLSDPTFMARHALNLTNRANWTKLPAGQDGKSGGYQYTSPEEEARHLELMQEEAAASQTDTAFETAVEAALDRPDRSSSSFAEQALTWARSKRSGPQPEDDTERRMRERAIVAAAAIAARDGTLALRAANLDWIRHELRGALSAALDIGAAHRGGLRLNILATAFYGWVQLLRAGLTEPEDFRRVLELAIFNDPAGVHGFAASVITLAEVDVRFPRSVLRSALMASVHPISTWDNRSNRDHLEAVYATKIANAVDAEIEWLAGKRLEPDWPDFPMERPRKRRGLRIGGDSLVEELQLEPEAKPTERVYHQTAAMWIRAASVLGKSRGPWIEEVLERYWEWTFIANGDGLAKHEQVDHAPDEWNQVFFEVLAVFSSDSALRERVTTAISKLSDEPFFDILKVFLRAFDTVYFSGTEISEVDAASLRTSFATRMRTAHGWEYLRGDTSDGVEVHLGPAISVLFFNDFNGFGIPPKCYLLPPGIERTDAMLATIVELACDCPSPLVALVSLNCFVVSPKQSHLPGMVQIAKRWLEIFPDNTTFWIRNGIGKRLCDVMSAQLRTGTALKILDLSQKLALGNSLASLVRLGVSEASALEETVAKELVEASRAQ
jgi:hypothetical protein